MKYPLDNFLVELFKIKKIKEFIPEFIKKKKIIHSCFGLVKNFYLFSRVMQD